MTFEANLTGAHGEAVCIAELIRRGYTVSIPHVYEARYDIVLDLNDGRRLLKVQIKTGWMDNGRFRVELRGTNKLYNRQERTVYDESEVDAFLLYSPDMGEIFWLWYDEAPKTGINRLPSSMEAYRLDNQLP